MSIQLNKDKSIGKVLYIVEGGKTEPYILHRIFTKIFDYQLEMFLRDKGYHKYNSKENVTSQVFVINAEESNIKNIAKDNEFLNNLFAELIENYDFDVDNAAIYYFFDRDSKSNTDPKFIEDMLSILANARENKGFQRQGLLLLSYPSIESFTLSNFEKQSFDRRFETGTNLKECLHKSGINHQNISEESIVSAVRELFHALGEMEIQNFDIDAFGETNREIFDYEENVYVTEGVYRALSLLCVSLIDLGLIEVEE